MKVSPSIDKQKFCKLLSKLALSKTYKLEVGHLQVYWEALRHLPHIEEALIQAVSRSFFNMPTVSDLIGLHHDLKMGKEVCTVSDAEIGRASCRESG